VLLFAGFGVSLILSEGILTTFDVWLGCAACRPLALSWWAFVPKSPPLDPSLVSNSEVGSRFYKPYDPNFNQQGFRDRDDFGNVQMEGTLRILLLGDSFTYGAAAVYDGSNSGFADLLEEKLNHVGAKKGIVWNTGIPGIGQRQQLLHLRRYFPIMRPQLVLLAFSENDFSDNTQPLGLYYVYTDGTWANRYVSADDGAARTLTPQEAWLRGKGYAFESRPVPGLLRTVSVAYRSYRKGRWLYWNLVGSNRLSARANDEPDREKEITRELLEEISDYVRQHDSRLIVMIIPSAETMIDPGANSRSYASATKLLQELSIAFIDMRPHLSLADYTPEPDKHLTKEAHRKVSEILFNYISSGVVLEGAK
jgi:hypothetical protein